MTAEELKHFVGIKYNKILEISLKQPGKVLYGKLKDIASVHPKKSKTYSHENDAVLLNFDIIKDVNSFKHHRDNRKFVTSKELLPEEIDSIGVVEL